jgi:hypothetical protein
MALLTKDARTALLAGAGLAPGIGGYDLDQLERFARERGWTFTRTPSTMCHGRPGKWRAFMMIPAGADEIRPVFTLGVRGAGRSEAEALEKALARDG